MLTLQFHEDISLEDDHGSNGGDHSGVECFSLLYEASERVFFLICFIKRLNEVSFECDFSCILFFAALDPFLFTFLFTESTARCFSTFAFKLGQTSNSSCIGGINIVFSHNQSSWLFYFFLHLCFSISKCLGRSCRICT